MATNQDRVGVLKAHFNDVVVPKIVALNSLLAVASDNYLSGWGPNGEQPALTEIKSQVASLQRHMNWAKGVCDGFNRNAELGEGPPVDE